ncbi:MAG: acyltransferase [Terracidiphilus sp.]
MRHSANLDILRTFAVSSVLIEHLVRTMNSQAGFSNALIIDFTHSIGRAGVIAFFVHTSLVLMYSLERMACSAQKLTLRFYLRRFFRIYPLSILCVIIVLILHIPGNTWGGAEAATPLVIFSNLLLVQNLITKVSVIDPLWSLPYEVEMYLVLPALYYLALKRRGALYLWFLFAFFCGFGFLVALKSGGHLNMAAYIPCFLSGVICFSLRDRIRALLPSVLWPLFLLLLFSGYCLANLGGKPRFWIGWIFCLLLGFGINIFHNSANKLINFVAEKIALYSYGLYLLHIPILYLVFMIFRIRNILLGPLLFIALTLFASFITYHVFESPFIEIGRKLSSRPPRAPDIPGPVHIA